MDQVEVSDYGLLDTVSPCAGKSGALSLAVDRGQGFVEAEPDAVGLHIFHE